MDITRREFLITSAVVAFTSQIPPKEPEKILFNGEVFVVREKRHDVTVGVITIHAVPERTKYLMSAGFEIDEHGYYVAEYTDDYEDVFQFSKIAMEAINRTPGLCASHIDWKYILGKRIW